MEIQLSKTFRQFVVQRDGDGLVRNCKSVSQTDLPEGDVTIRTDYSSLNFKDALCCEGHPGVVKSLPQVPGIDCVGTIVESTSENWKVGDQVIVGHADFGTSSPGGWSEFVRVPENWLTRLPDSLSAEEAITLGTAGFTAAGCVEALIRNGLNPENGEIVVTGATGGVGILAVKLLAKLGYRVIASTGKPDRAQWLLDHGAAEINSREAVVDQSNRPLLTGKWAGAVDTVGGQTLGTVIRSTKVGGVVSACGVVAGHELPLTVYPFILRGVTLCGIDSANTPPLERRHLWAQLAGPWRLDDVLSLAKFVNLDQIEDEVQAILKGNVVGRVVLKLKP